MSQELLNYASPSSNGRDPVESFLVIAFFWLAIFLFCITAGSVTLAILGPYYMGSPLLAVARVAEFAFQYGKLVSALFALIALPWAWFFRRFGWQSKVPALIAVTLVLFYWFIAHEGNGPLRRMLYGGC